jgi:release factor glutamine methyltransferase
MSDADATRHEDTTAAQAGVTLTQLLAGAAEQLSSAGIEHADFEACSLLAAAAQVGVSQVRSWQIMGSGVGVLGEGVQADFRGFLSRRLRREPLQYITGHVGFRYLDVLVGPGVFIPRPETEMIVDLGIEKLGGAPIPTYPLVADLCAGSGAIGLSVASEFTGSKVVGIEKSDAAFSWLQKNAERVNTRFPNSNYTPLLGDATEPSAALNFSGGQRFDCVLSNPPYVPESEPPLQPEVKYDPEMALYGGSADGMAIPGKVISCAAQLLREGGFVAIEHDISQAPAMAAAMRSSGFIDVAVRNDLTGRPRFTVGIRA